MDIKTKQSLIDLAHPYFYYDFHDKSTGKANYKDMSCMIFQEEFRSENNCINWLFRTRWPQGRVS